MNLAIAIIGALVSVLIAIVGALLSIKNSITLQTRKLKEVHYVRYIEALHNLASNDKLGKYVSDYTFARDKLFIIASENVVLKILDYEEKAVGKVSEVHDEYLTQVVMAIRKDLRIKDKKFPQIYLKKGSKWYFSKITKEDEAYESLSVLTLLLQLKLISCFIKLKRQNNNF